MVLVGAVWCPACLAIKNTIVTPMRKEGELNDVVFTYVDQDEQTETAEQIKYPNKTIPIVAVYTPLAAGKWKKETLIGYQPRQPIRNLIRNSISFIRKNR